MKANKDNKKMPLCTVCLKPATRNVDGEASCDRHAALIYENQLEDYTSKHMADGDWQETLALSGKNGRSRAVVVTAKR